MKMYNINNDMNKMNIWKIFIKCIGILAAFILIGFFLLLIVYLIPGDSLIDNVKDAADKYDLSYSVNITDKEEYGSFDLATDALILNTAICRAYDNSLENALLNPRFSYNESIQSHADYGKMVPDFINYVKYDNKDTIILNYARYWHGYLILIIPALLFMSSGDIRTLLIFVQFVLSFLLLLEIYKRDKLYSFIAFLLMFFINVISCSAVFQLYDVYFITVIFSLLILKDKNNDSNKYIYLFVINGILIAYLDLLTYQLVAWAIPLIIYLLKNSFKLKDSIQKIFFSGVAWLFGYGGMWFSKWLLATIFTGNNVIQNGLDEAYIRSDPMNVAGIHTHSYLETINNIFLRTKGFLIPILIVGLLLIILYSMKYNYHLCINLNTIKNNIPYFLIGLVPFAWYFIVRNHSSTHSSLEYRHLTISLLCLFVIVRQFINRKTC